MSASAATVRRPQAEPSCASRDGALDADVAARLERFDWRALETELGAEGCGVLPGLLQRDECEALRALYDDDERFRSRVIMARHGYGRGEYRYFAYPLPDPVAAWRGALYPRLAPVANRWNEALGSAVRYPAAHADFLARCHAAGQTQPTPLLLRYGAGDYNCLHQDLYGEHVFPLQVIVLLAAPGREFEGGELVLTEQRPRMQSRPLVVPLAQGDAAVIAVERRPMPGTRGTWRVAMRHGVAKVRRGARHALGIIFHDAA